MNGMPSADLLFRRLLKELRPSVAREGFRRNSQIFVIESEECWGIINFQKSLYSSAHEKKFTVNVAIAAKRILSFYGEAANKPPPHWKCHWETRIGHFIPGQGDRWWTLSDESSFDPVFTEVAELVVGKAVPILKDHLTEERLLALWAENVGGFEYPMLKYKSILLAERGRFNQLPTIFERIREICRGGLAAEGAELHIAQIKRQFGLNLQ